MSMVEFRVNVSTKDGKTKQLEVKDQHAGALLGKKVGDEIDGILVGMPGYRLVITGGSDKDGFPMREDISGIGRKNVLLTEGKGFREAERGQRKRRLVRGNMVSQEIAQINMKVVKEGSRPVKEQENEGSETA
jgi:small subunit ribosomal protein S6e